MNIQEKLQESAGKLLDFVEKSGDFVVEQAPLYVQELVEYHFFENLLGLVICVFFLISIISACLLTIRNRLKYSDDKFPECLFALAFSIVFTIPCIIEGSDYIKECYKAKYAPRVLIVEKLNKLR